MSSRVLEKCGCERDGSPYQHDNALKVNRAGLFSIRLSRFAEEANSYGKSYTTMAAWRLRGFDASVRVEHEAPEFRRMYSSTRVSGRAGGRPGNDALAFASNEEVVFCVKGINCPPSDYVSGNWIDNFNVINREGDFWPEKDQRRNDRQGNCKAQQPVLERAYESRNPKADRKNLPQYAKPQVC